MSAENNKWERLALIVTITELMAARQKDFGRTAAMKFIYLLQTLKNVPLGYNFSLYSYGPFASPVLDDLSYAETLGAVTEKVLYFSGGYGYDIKPSEAAHELKTKGNHFLQQYQSSINWVIDQFADYSASALELISTIVYADQEMKTKQTSMPLLALVQLVREIKPHFTNAQIERHTKELLRKGLLSSVLV